MENKKEFKKLENLCIFNKQGKSLGCAVECPYCGGINVLPSDDGICVLCNNTGKQDLGIWASSSINFETGETIYEDYTGKKIKNNINEDNNENDN